MRMKWLAAAACVSGWALFACSSAPERPMPYEVLAQLKLGTTTMADAEAKLGAPEGTESLPNGGHAWVYRFAPDTVPTRPDLPAPTDPRRTFEVVRLVFGPTGLLILQESSRSMLGVRDGAHRPEHEALRDILLPGEQRP